MSNDSENNDTITKLKEMGAKIQGAILAKEQGEALKRLSTPLTLAEAQSLGYMNPKAIYGLGALGMIEKLIDDFAGKPDPNGMVLQDFCFSIYRGSGSINFKRGENVSSSIGTIGQYTPPIEKRTAPTPETVNLNE